MKTLFDEWLSPEERQEQLEAQAREAENWEKNNASDSERGGFGALAAMDRLNSDIAGSDASSDFGGDFGFDGGYDGGWDGDCGGDGGGC